MKKSLVISTIATVLVVVVALTTATFAWFSSAATTQVTSSFTVAPTNNAVTITAWQPGAGNTPGSYVMPQGVWTIATGESEYEFDYTNSVNAEAVADATPQTSYLLMAPTAALDGTTYIPNTGSDNDYDGLPGINYLTASGADGEAAIDNANVRPVAVRFALTASQYATTDVKVKVTIGVPQDATGTAHTAASNARVYLQGIRNGAAADANNQNFLIATDYSWVAPDNANTETPVSFTATASSGAVATNTGAGHDDITLTTAYDQNQTDLTGSLNPRQINNVANIDRVATEISFRVQRGTQYDCVLYIWVDGTTANDAAASGQFEVLVNFSGSEVKVGP